MPVLRYMRLLKPALFPGIILIFVYVVSRGGTLDTIRLTVGAAQAAQQGVYYEPDIKGIINRDCARCHSGISRNLMDYDTVQAYANSGMLRGMISPGGPMSRFAGDDSRTIIAWLDSGAPEKSQTVMAGFGRSGPPALSPKGYEVTVPLDRITYTNTMQFIIARDCLECHSIPFRNLTTYENVKFYAENNLLKKLVLPGGAMHRFAGPDSKYIVAWIDNGAPK